MTMFLLPRATEISDLPIKETYSRIELNKNCIIRFWATISMKLLFTLSKDLKQWEKLDL